MYSLIFPTILLAITAINASPIDNQLRPRASPSPTCTSMKTKTTTVAGAEETLTGPFQLLANSSGLKQDGFFAHAGAPSIYPTIIFDVSPPRRDENATTFWLNGARHLLSFQDGVVYYANDVSPVYTGNFDDSNVVISSDQTITNKLVCDIDKDSCAFECSVAGYNYVCLADPTFQPDWRLSEHAGHSGGGCVPFNPVVVPI